MGKTVETLSLKRVMVYICNCTRCKTDPIQHAALQSGENSYSHYHVHVHWAISIKLNVLVENLKTAMIIKIQPMRYLFKLKWVGPTVAIKLL